uniref:protein-serine/threonine phosphatase n=1 Tax=Anopheles epiroticus TaxID=199890 RepID=A0A182P7P6_9DIPT
MGAYLSEPLKTKDSSDESSEYLACGSSSMQGWRISQEDAHNCILNFDDQCSFFAVYDGHGGAEVAQYCSLHLPSFLKTVEAYGAKNFEKALKDAFLGFDATLLQESVIEELKLLTDKPNGEDEADEEEEEEEDDNVEDLCKEAVMPLNEVLQKYRKDTKPPGGGEAKNQRVAAIKEGNCSKPVSPYLKGKRRAASDEGAGGSREKRPVKVEGSSSSSGDSASSDAEADPAAEAKKETTAAKEETGEAVPADSTVSSSSNKAMERVKEATPQPEPSSSSSSKVSPGKSEPDGEQVVAAGSSGSRKAEQSDEISDTDGNIAVKSTDAEEEGGSGSSTGKENCAPDSSSSDGSKQTASKLNGDAGKVGSSGAVSSSSSGSAQGQENGSCDSGSPGGSNSGASPSTKVHSSSAKPSPKNGPPADVSMSMDDTDDDDDDDDDESDSDEEFPHAEEPTDDTSSTDEGEEDAYGEEGSAEEGEEEQEEYHDIGDYINEEDAAFMKTITDEPGKDSGCTAVVALLHGKDLYVANAGDSRCVVCRNGEALEMSFDHKPEDTIEYERIEKAGGRVTLDGRVNGGLNLSRAIGDHGYKMNKSLPAEEQMISALPDIEKITIGPEDEFMVLACDGIWNFMTSEQVVQFVKERIHKPNVKLSKICEELFDHCLAPHTRGDGTGCDNMTAIIVQFKPNFTGAGSRKRAASNSVADAVDGNDADGVSSATKKVKTDGAVDAAASSTTETTDSSNGVVSTGKEAEAAEATEAAAAVASIADDDTVTTPAVASVDTAASSEAASSST